MQKNQEQIKIPRSENFGQILAYSLCLSTSPTSSRDIQRIEKTYEDSILPKIQVQLFQQKVAEKLKKKPQKRKKLRMQFEQKKVLQVIQVPQVKQQGSISSNNNNEENTNRQNEEADDLHQSCAENEQDKQKSKEGKPPLKNPIKNAVKKVNRLLINFLKKQIKNSRFPSGETQGIQKFVNKELEQKNFLNHTFIKSLILLKKLNFSMQIVRSQLLKMLQKSQQKQQKKNARIYRSFMEYKERAISTVQSFQDDQLIDCIKFMYNRHPINRITNVLQELQNFNQYTEKYLNSISAKNKVNKSK